MSAYVVLIGYCVIGSIIGGIVYALIKEMYEDAGPDDPAIAGAIAGCFWPFAIFVLLAFVVARLSLWIIREMTNPKDNV